MTQFKAQCWEKWIYLKNKPVAFLLVETLRRLGPVVNVPGVGYFVNDPDVGYEVLRDGASFNSSGPGSIGYLITQVLGPSALLNMDGPEHRRLKNTLRTVFAPKFLDTLVEEALNPLLQKELILPLGQGRTVDIVLFSKELVMTMSARIAGLNVHDRAEVLQLSKIIGEVTSLAGLGKKELTPMQVATAKRKITLLEKLIATVYQDKNPPQNLSLTRELKKSGLSFAEALPVIMIVLIAGSELMNTAIARMVALLIDTNNLAPGPREKPWVDGVIDEALRLISPSTITLRSVSEDTVRFGRRFKKNRRVCVVNYSMLKTKKIFPNPTRFDPYRVIPTKYKHTWFGGGPHFCLGFSLAQKQLRLVLETLLSLNYSFRITSRRVTFNRTFPGYEHLIIRAYDA